MAEIPKPTTLTTDQRVKIRSLLDKHFDDGVGRYLDGYSDQKIADAVGVPRVVVEGIREPGYGPIKIDPEIVRLMDEVSKMEIDMKSIKNRLDKLSGGK